MGWDLFISYRFLLAGKLNGPRRPFRISLSYVLLRNAGPSELVLTRPGALIGGQT